MSEEIVELVPGVISASTQHDGGSCPVGKKITMASLQVYDRPMCCSTGVCGPKIDPVLPRFAADLKWLTSQGVAVERFNLSQQPGAFSAHPEVRSALSAGLGCLPLIIADGRIVSRGVYPSRETLATWAGVKMATAASLPSAECCSPSGCC